MGSATTTWLDEQRSKAWDAYKAAPPPDRVAHIWRYTDPILFQQDDAALTLTRRPGLIAADGPAPAGVEISELAGATDTDPVRDRLGTAVPSAMGRLEALNLARWQEGLLVRIPRGRTIEAPVNLLSRVGRDPFQASRLLVVAEENTEVTVVRDYTSADGADSVVQMNDVIEVFAGPGARVRIAVVQNLGATTGLHLTQRTIADRAANVETIVCTMGSAVTKADVGAILVGERADSESWGVVLADGKQHFGHHTVHEHRAGRTRSNFDYKTVLRDKAHSVYTGLIRIDKTSADCAAYQENRNLMLSDTAKADSIPELEILNNEVQCTHGATMGPIEPEYIFYLMARGIPRPDAIRLFVDGFVEPALSRLPEGIRQRLRDHLQVRLEALS